ncbi:hypothetical protein REPUB_Repub20aG0053200 [Reevesia pubescens]
MVNKCLHTKGRVEVNTSSNVAVTRWTPPKLGDVKLNVDASWLAEDGSSRLGIAFKDDKGEILLSEIANVHQVSDPMHAEVLAIKWGSEFAWDYNVSAITLETDSLLAVNELQKGMLSL